jgi:flagellar export protein FliJ
MARFHFKLEAVRSLREQAEQRAQEELARELAFAAAQQARVAEAGKELDTARAAGAAPSGATLTPQELVARQAFVERRERERELAVAELEVQEQAVEVRRGDLERAAQAREVLERAKERARETHRAHEAKVEEDALAEVALTLHRRRADGGAA